MKNAPTFKAPSALLSGAILATSLFAASNRASACFRLTDQHTGRLDQDGNYVRVKQYLTVPFHLREGRLALLYKWDAPLPRDAFVRVFLLTSSRRIGIVHLIDLRGHVSIQSPREALAFVRLRTSPTTFGAFGPTYDGCSLEVVDRRQVSEAFTLGDTSQTEFLKTESNGFSGVVDARFAKSAGIPLARCKPQANGFQVTRTLLTLNPYDGRQYLVRVVEWVGKDGNYAVRSHKVIRAVGPPWYIPMLL